MHNNKPVKRTKTALRVFLSGKICLHSSIHLSPLKHTDYARSIICLHKDSCHIAYHGFNLLALMFFFRCRLMSLYAGCVLFGITVFAPSVKAHTDSAAHIPVVVVWSVDSPILREYIQTALFTVGKNISQWPIDDRSSLICMGERQHDGI